MSVTSTFEFIYVFQQMLGWVTNGVGFLYISFITVPAMLSLSQDGVQLMFAYTDLRGQQDVAYFVQH